MIQRTKIRRYEQDDESQAIRLIVGKLPPEERNMAFEKRLRRWRWQYNENPKNPDNQPLIWIAESGGAVVGLIGTVPIELRTPLGISQAAWGADLVVDPNFRGMGIGKELVNTWMKSVPIAMGRGYNPVSYSIGINLGFKTIMGFTTAILVLSRMRYLLQSLRGKQYMHLAKAVGILARPNPVLGRIRRTALVTDTLPSGTALLWTKASRVYSFAVERNLEYLTWRFLHHPTHCYYFIVMGDLTHPVGLAIVRLDAGEMPLGIISEMIVDPQNVDIALSLFAEAVAFLNSKGAHSVLFDLPPLLALPILKAYRCILKCKLGMIIYTNDNRIEASGLLNPKLWYLSRSDSDVDY